MTAESPADLLRRAADLVEQRARDATPGPWELEYSYGGERVQALFVGCCGGENHCSKDCYDGTRGIGGFDEDPDNRWSSLMHPGLAEPFAAWLRAEADHAATAQAYLDAHHGGAAPPGTWSTEYRHRHAVALARVLIGEDQP